MNLNNIYKKSLIFFFIISVIVILLNSLAQLYEDRMKIFNKLGLRQKPQISANPLDQSQRQIPPKNYQDLKTYGNEDKLGAWTAPFDWNVTAIHSVLLPDETVMTFGSYAIEEKEKNKDVRENKKLVLTDKFELDRDKGDYQWRKHDVLAGVDFDIWDPKKGFGDDSHTLIKKPLVLR